MPAPTSPAALDLDHADFLRLLRSGDDAAFERLVRELSPRLFAVARRFFPAEEDAADAVQEAFLSAFKALAQFDGQSKISTWLHRITVNACLMKLRSRKRRPERSIEEMLPVFDETGHQSKSSLPWNPSPGGGIESDEMRRVVRGCIEELPEAYRTVLVLRDIEGLSTEEAGNVLQVTPNTVKIRLHRARQALKELLNPHLSRGVE